MFNQHLYNSSIYQGNNLGYDRRIPPVYSESIITAVSHVQQGLSIAQFLMGGKGGVNSQTYSLFSKGNDYAFSMWQSKRFVVGDPFNILSIGFSLTEALSDDMLIIPVLSFDDDERRIAGNIMSVDTYPGWGRSFTLTPYSFGSDVHGESNFCLEIHFRGTDLVSVALPILIDIETESQG